MTTVTIVLIVTTVTIVLIVTKVTIVLIVTKVTIVLIVTIAVEYRMKKNRRHRLFTLHFFFHLTY